MAKVTVAVLQTAWDCKWSRPGHRFAGVPDERQPETLWVCVRTGARTDLDNRNCETCQFWQADGAAQS